MDGIQLQSVTVATEHLGALVTEELNAKWRELLAVNRTWWWPGMLVQDGDRYTEESRYPRSVRVPDWRDPATLGCLLAMVRKAWGDDEIYFGSSLNTKRKRWSWVMRGVDRIGQGDTEAEALLAALEAAP